MIVNGLGEADPDVEQPKPTAQASEKAVGNQAPEIGRAQQQGIVGPLRRPGKNHKQYSGGGTDEHEQQHQQPMKPDSAA